MNLFHAAFGILSGAGLGAVVGSALAGLYASWPAGEATAQGTVSCSGCNGVIRHRWSMPLVWALRLRGRCRACGAAVDPMLPGIELLAIAIGAIAAALFPDPFTAFAAAMLGWQLLLFAALDLAFRWLPDPLNLLLAATGLGFAAIAQSEALPDLLLGLVAGYASLELVRRGYRRIRGYEGLGGGDPKLFAAIGCWLGWQWLPWVLMLAASGGLFAVAGLMLAGRRPSTAANLPFGTLLALAAWPVWLLTHAN